MYATFKNANSFEEI